MGPPDPEPPQKFFEKGPKSQKIVDFDYIFQTFRTFFGTFRGSGLGDPKLLSGDFFETFRGFGVLGSVNGGRDPNYRGQNPQTGKREGFRGQEVPPPQKRAF